MVSYANQFKPTIQATWRADLRQIVVKSLPSGSLNCSYSAESSNLCRSPHNFQLARWQAGRGPRGKGHKPLAQAPGTPTTKIGLQIFPAPAGGKSRREHPPFGRIFGVMFFGLPWCSLTLTTRRHPHTGLHNQSGFVPGA